MAIEQVTRYELLRERTQCYDLPNFKPVEISAGFLKSLGLEYPIHPEDLQMLEEGNRKFSSLYQTRGLTPEKSYFEVEVDASEELEIHNYTGICPINVLEVTPSKGSCAYACQYCLVTDGNHIAKTMVFSNYTRKLENSLKRNTDREIFYYFSPKTEAFSEPHLYNGLAHDILRTFLRHFQQYPDSKCRIFVASKAGLSHLLVRHKGDTLLKLLHELRGKMQYNGSIGIMPEYLRNVLEPNVANMDERLEVLQVCQSMGIFAESVLCQPLILNYLTPENVETYIGQLASAGVKNIKPEFLTAEVKNLVLIAQYIHHFDPEILRDFFAPYLQDDNRDHIKQRCRRAPHKKYCVEKLALISDTARRHGITVSICNWVKRELSKEANWVNKVDALSKAAGYRCLGYQNNIFASTPIATASPEFVSQTDTNTGARQ